MGKIAVLSRSVIDRIAAGECVERPAAVAKELIENAIDAGATAITVEIRDGGIAYLRVTDDGRGIDAEDVRTAFLRHATSKITSAEDLETISSLGFRGEALASIAAVSRVELITKPKDALTGIRYTIEGGEEKSFEEIGAPDGTTIIIRDLFYNTPARAKFLKSPMTEGSHIASYMEELALSSPGIAFTLLSGSSVKLSTSGSGRLKDVIYGIFGRAITAELLAVRQKEELPEAIQVSGWIAKPAVFRSSRTYENYFVNGRYVKSNVISKAIEDGYGNMLMQHSYPFTALMIDLSPEEVDVNVHPAKMEVRFANERAVYDAVLTAIKDTLAPSTMIVPGTLATKETIREEANAKKEAAKEARKLAAEPYETVRRQMRETDGQAHTYPKTAEPVGIPTEAAKKEQKEDSPFFGKGTADDAGRTSFVREDAANYQTFSEQLSFLSEEERKKREVIGQVFSTYWLVEYGEELLIIDQHAAHEKILYERLMASYEKEAVLSEELIPPMVITTNAREREILAQYGDAFQALGFTIEAFGDTEYKVSAVPSNLRNADIRAIFNEFFTSAEGGKGASDLPSYVHAVATEACKAAVKGGGTLSRMEADALLTELMTLKDPYHCPHGRPTMISLSRREFEKRFRRIV